MCERRSFLNKRCFCANYLRSWMAEFNLRKNPESSIAFFILRKCRGKTLPSFQQIPTAELWLFNISRINVAWLPKMKIFARVYIYLNFQTALNSFAFYLKFSNYVVSRRKNSINLHFANPQYSEVVEIMFL